MKVLRSIFVSVTLLMMAGCASNSASNQETITATPTVSKSIRACEAVTDSSAPADIHEALIDALTFSINDARYGYYEKVLALDESGSSTLLGSKGYDPSQVGDMAVEQYMNEEKLISNFISLDTSLTPSVMLGAVAEDDEKTAGYEDGYYRKLIWSEDKSTRELWMFMVDGCYVTSASQLNLDSTLPSDYLVFYFYYEVNKYSTQISQLYKDAIASDRLQN
jgi:hypothetical protein